MSRRKRITEAVLVLEEVKKEEKIYLDQSKVAFIVEKRGEIKLSQCNNSHAIFAMITFLTVGGLLVVA